MLICPCLFCSCFPLTLSTKPVRVVFLKGVATAIFFRRVVQLFSADTLEQARSGTAGRHYNEQNAGNGGLAVGWRAGVSVEGWVVEMAEHG